MSANWVECKIGDACDVGDGAHAKVERQRSGIPYLTSRNIGQGSLKLNDIDYISAEDFERLFSSSSKAVRRAQPGDILMGIIGTFGNVYRYRDTDTFGVSSSVALLRPKKDLIDSDFLYYLVSSSLFQEAHSSYKSGSAQGYTNIPTIKAIPIRFPPLPQQRTIAEILGTLDNKIDLNRRINETLETMTQSLFQAWFVEAMQENLPKGWRVCELQEAFEVLDGKTLAPNDRDESGPFAAFGANGIIARTNKAWVDSPCIVLGKIGSCGALHRSPEACWVTNNAFAVRAGQSRSLEFTWQTLKSIDFTQFIGGSANPYMPLKNFGHFEVNLPTAELLDAFQTKAGAIRSLIEANQRESNTLITMRNALQPKLLSGEIQVGHIEL